MLSSLFRAWRKARNALARFRRLPPARLFGDHARARRIRRGVAVAGARSPRPERVVVTLTSIPDRRDSLAPALFSLIDQTWPADRILLAWPDKSLRTGAAYPPPPDLPEGVDILRCEDVGPATKLLPALVAEPDALLIVVDDDVIYPADFIETLVRAHRRDPAAALGWRGWRVEPGRDPRDYLHVFATAMHAPCDVDILLGTWGYLVPPGALDGAVHDFSGWPPEVRWVDDIWISGHLARRGVPRRVIPARGLPIETQASGVAALTFGLNRSGLHDRIAIEAFRPWWGG